MKPEDLFIGAWVQNPLGGKGWVRSIHYVTKEDGHGGYYLITLAFSKDGDSYTKICEKDVRPIPLTPEILEKNGWVIDKENEVVSRFVWAQKPPKNKLEFTTVEISFYDKELIGVKCLVEIRCSSSSNGINSFHSCDCENIHQLQAALRLCGIEKEIEIYEM